MSVYVTHSGSSRVNSYWVSTIIDVFDPCVIWRDYGCTSPTHARVYISAEALVLSLFNIVSSSGGDNLYYKDFAH